MNENAISKLDEVKAGLQAAAASNPCVVSNPRSACVTNCGWTCPLVVCTVSGLLFC